MNEDFVEEVRRVGAGNSGRSSQPSGFEDSSGIAVNLNLARRLRPTKFSEIIGQDIPVRMLMNSLFLDKLFPVYLFSGQRGTGKTSTARIFAAALNCELLDEFRSDPKKKIPCGNCDSCRRIFSGTKF